MELISLIGVIISMIVGIIAILKFLKKCFDKPNILMEVEDGNAFIKNYGKLDWKIKKIYHFFKNDCWVGKEHFDYLKEDMIFFSNKTVTEDKLFLFIKELKNSPYIQGEYEVVYKWWFINKKRFFSIIKFEKDLKCNEISKKEFKNKFKDKKVS